MNAVTVCFADVPPPGWEGRLESFARKVLASLGRDGWELSVLLCGDRTMSELNLRYRGKEGTTDVLSFAQDPASGDGFPGDGRLRGDIAVSLDELRENSARFAVGEDEELRRLLVHGILHIDGMDHATNDEKAEPMLRLQESILEELADMRVMPAEEPPGAKPPRGRDG